MDSKEKLEILFWKLCFFFISWKRKLTLPKPICFSQDPSNNKSNSKTFRWHNKKVKWNKIEPKKRKIFCSPNPPQLTQTLVLASIKRIFLFSWSLKQWKSRVQAFTFYFSFYHIFSATKQETKNREKKKEGWGNQKPRNWPGLGSPEASGSDPDTNSRNGGRWEDKIEVNVALSWSGRVVR